MFYLNVFMFLFLKFSVLKFMFQVMENIDKKKVL